MARRHGRLGRHESRSALLFLLGRTGWVGGPAGHLGISFYGTQLGIIAAMLFVSVPFAVNSARVAFEAIDPRLELAARNLGATPWHTFRRITLPLGFRGVLTGAVLVYARSIREFGAVVIIAYYPATAPVQIYNLFLQSGLTQSAAAAVVLLIVSPANRSPSRSPRQRSHLPRGTRHHLKQPPQHRAMPAHATAIRATPGRARQTTRAR